MLVDVPKRGLVHEKGLVIAAHADALQGLRLALGQGGVKRHMSRSEDAVGQRAYCVTPDILLARGGCDSHA